MPKGAYRSRKTAEQEHTVNTGSVTGKYTTTYQDINGGGYGGRYSGTSAPKYNQGISNTYTGTSAPKYNQGIAKDKFVPQQSQYYNPDPTGRFSPYYSSPNRDGVSKANSLPAMIEATKLKKSGGFGGIGYASPFSASQAYMDAMAYTNSLLDQLNSGRTSYSDKIDSLMAQIEGRDKFSYDFDKDPLFQNALASAMSAGQTAMQDTIGQASALTGGYGSSYATSAGNQAYNDFVKGAYDQLPQYYGLALDAYNAEGAELYNQLGMYQTADQNEYSRLMSAYEANLANAQNMYNQEYNNYWDTMNYNQSAAKFNASQKQSQLEALYGSVGSSASGSGKAGSGSASGEGPTYNLSSKERQEIMDAYIQIGPTAFENKMRAYEPDMTDDDIDWLLEWADEQTKKHAQR